MKKSILSYCLIWLVTVMTFWLGMGSDAMGYSLIAFYVVLPVSALVCSISLGAGGCSLKGGIIGSLFIGFAYSLAQYATFSLANMISISFSRINPFSIEAMIGGALTAFIGFGIGAIIKKIRGI